MQKVQISNLIAVLGRSNWQELERSYLAQKAREEFDALSDDIDSEIDNEESMLNNYIEAEDE